MAFVPSVTIVQNTPALMNAPCRFRVVVTNTGATAADVSHIVIESLNPNLPCHIAQPELETSGAVTVGATTSVAFDFKATMLGQMLATNNAATATPAGVKLIAIVTTSDGSVTVSGPTSVLTNQEPQSDILVGQAKFDRAANSALLVATDATQLTP